MQNEAKIFHIDEMQWVDLGGGHLDKAMVTEPKTGMIVNVSHYPKGYMKTDLGVVKKGEFVWYPANVEMDHGATMTEDCTFLFITNAPFDIERLDAQES